MMARRRTSPATTASTPPADDLPADGDAGSDTTPAVVSDPAPAPVRKPRLSRSKAARMAAAGRPWPEARS